MTSFLSFLYGCGRIGWDLAIRVVLALLVPPRCAGCDELLKKRSAFCAPCAATLETAPRESLARFHYAGALKTAITRFKYGDRPDLAEPLGQVFVRGLREAHGVESWIVVPVPLHSTRLAERGFNQVALLGHVVAKHTGSTLFARALSRKRATAAQASLGVEARTNNVEDAFEARAPSEIRGRHVLLIDDVTTTGSTLRACRAALERAGARRVTCFALASQELRRGGKSAGARRGSAR